MKRYLVVLLLCLSSGSGAQVVHNFEMGPENTNCGRLDSLRITEPGMAQVILESKFRLYEEMQISRYTAPRKLIFASCDGEEGFLLSYQNDSEIYVYENVTTGSWEAIRNAQDPRELFSIKKDSLERFGKKAP